MKIIRQNFSVFSIMFSLLIFLGGASLLFSHEQQKKADETKKALLLEQKGVISGVVKDEEGHAISGVTVEMTSPRLMEIPPKITGENGSFQLLNLPQGTYELTFSLPGFKTEIREVTIDQLSVAVDLTVIMEIAPIEGEIIVVSEEPLAEKYATAKYVATMRTSLVAADAYIRKEIYSLTKSIIKLQSLADQQAVGISTIMSSIEDIQKQIEKLDIRLKAVEEKIK